jgi:putative endonuclease
MRYRDFFARRLLRIELYSPERRSQGSRRTRSGREGGRRCAFPPYACYILASRRNGTLYIGVTSDLVGRIWQHKTKTIPGFTARYGCERLVYFEMLDSPEAAIMREKQMKEWRRDWKIALIESTNPDWADLYAGIAS